MGLLVTHNSEMQSQTQENNNSFVPMDSIRYRSGYTCVYQYEGTSLSLYLSAPACRDFRKCECLLRMSELAGSKRGLQGSSLPMRDPIRHNGWTLSCRVSRQRSIGGWEGPVLYTDWSRSDLRELCLHRLLSKIYTENTCVNVWGKH